MSHERLDSSIHLSRCSRRHWLKAGAAGALLAPALVPGRSRGADDAPAAEAPAADPAGVEWRNRQSGMAYRRLGRTGLMISEVISGGDPIKLDNYQHLDQAVERGLNYLDMAPAYNRGQCEEAIGKLLAGSSAKRDKVFLTTKISGYSGVRERLYREIFDRLPESKQAEILKRADELRASRGVDKPGYFLSYFPGQQNGFKGPYLRIAMMSEFAEQVEGSKEAAAFIRKSLEESLKRVGTDHFDIMMCPHGASAPEELQGPEVAAVFQELKKEGKVRFLGVTSHNDPAGVLRAAADAGHYDVVMMAYNVINGGHVEEAIRHARSRDVGMIAMKAAMAVATHHKALQPIPQWRIDKVQQIVPGQWKAPVKAYIWALQNPGISAVISNLWDHQYIEENLGIAGVKVELQPA